MARRHRRSLDQGSHARSRVRPTVGGRAAAPARAGGLRGDVGRGDPDTLVSVYNLASLLKDQGKLDEAILLFRRELAGCEATLGATHPDTLTSVNNLAGLLHDQGKLDEAEQLLRRVERRT